MVLMTAASSSSFVSCLFLCSIVVAIETKAVEEEQVEVRKQPQLQQQQQQPQQQQQQQPPPIPQQLHYQQQQYHQQPEAEKDRFYMPGITGRFKEQIERRKLLWQKKDDKKRPPIPAAPSTLPNRSVKVWETTTFAQDQDGKVASKFKRLMGIKDTAGESSKSTDVLKKQEEMFHSMEQQYEVARTATHTMRGVGLGFSSYQR